MILSKLFLVSVTKKLDQLNFSLITSGMEHLAPQTPPIHQNAAKKGLRRQVLHPVKNPADAFSHLPEIGKGKPPGQTRYILPVRCRFP